MTQQSKFTIREVTDTDWLWITEAHTLTAWESLTPQCRCETTLERLAGTVEAQLANLRSDNAPPHLAIVAHDSLGNKAGYLLVEEIRTAFSGTSIAYITGVYVADVYRRQGLGHLLMCTAEDWARQRNLPRIALNVAAHNNARLLYEEMGYQTEVLRMSKEIR